MAPGWLTIIAWLSIAAGLVSAAAILYDIYWRGRQPEEKQMRAELDQLLTHGLAAHGRRVRPAHGGDMEHEFTNECRAGAPGGRVSAPQPRYVR